MTTLAHGHTAVSASYEESNRRIAESVAVEIEALISPRLSPLDLRVLCIIRGYCRDQDWVNHTEPVVSEATNRDIQAGAGGIAYQTRRRSVDRLQALGLIRMEGNQKRRKYVLLPPPWPRLQEEEAG